MKSDENEIQEPTSSRSIKVRKNGGTDFIGAELAAFGENLSSLISQQDKIGIKIDRYRRI
jgi:hypothetical protein